MWLEEQITGLWGQTRQPPKQSLNPGGGFGCRSLFPTPRLRIQSRSENFSCPGDSDGMLCGHTLTSRVLPCLPGPQEYREAPALSSFLAQSSGLQSLSPSAHKTHTLCNCTSLTWGLVLCGRAFDLQPAPRCLEVTGSPKTFLALGLLQLNSGAGAVMGRGVS